MSNCTVFSGFKIVRQSTNSKDGRRNGSRRRGVISTNRSYGKPKVQETQGMTTRDQKNVFFFFTFMNLTGIMLSIFQCVVLLFLHVLTLVRRVRQEPRAADADRKVVRRRAPRLVGMLRRAPASRRLARTVFRIGEASHRQQALVAETCVLTGDLQAGLQEKKKKTMAGNSQVRLGQVYLDSP